MRVVPRGDHARIETDHLAVGHISVDVLPDGTKLPGGSALYSAVLAARWGATATVVTAGEIEVLEALLAGFDDDVEVVVQRAVATTTLATSYADGRRVQKVVARADEVLPVEASARVVHLAPVLCEVDSRWCAQRGAFVGLTPQGLLRHWAADGAITLHEPAGISGYRADAIVLSEEEEPYCGSLLASQPEETVVVVTRAERVATVRTPAGDAHVPALRVEGNSDLGAGDVFAAVLFRAAAEGTDPRDAVLLAHAAAAAKVAGEPGPAGVPARRAATALLEGRAREST